MNSDLEKLINKAREISHSKFGPKLAIHTPGMFVAYGRRGRYPAISLTGKQCSKNCLHCNGKLLETMLDATTPEELVKLGQKLWEQGELGMLLSGGSNEKGLLPWHEMLPAIQEISQTTGLILTAHVANIDLATAKALKKAGVRQGLIDVVGDAQTACTVLKQEPELKGQQRALKACLEADLEIAPHIIIGLDHGRINGEEKALDILADLAIKRVVFVVLMPLKGTAFADVNPPSVLEVAEFLAKARMKLPNALHHLGCARPRGRYRNELDALAVQLGINVLALPSDGALAMANKMNVEVKYSNTCCSLAEG